MKLNVYSRVSTEDQNVDQQARYTTERLIKDGHTIFQVIKDTESGTLPLNKRIKFLKLLNHSLENHAIDGIGIYNLDRLTRNWDDVTFIERFFRDNWEYCKLISTSDPIDLSNAAGRLMFRIRMATSCYMPEDMKEKQRIGIDRAREQGRYKGRKPGTKNKRKYVRRKG